jgi:membrane protein DedA with SNARE-associated domain
MQKIKNIINKYGAWACGAFRFTPGLRFPGHYMCGASNISYTKFLLVDGTAALLTVPTQVLLLGFYGDEILVYFKQFKISILIIASIAFLIWLYRKKFATKVLDNKA